MFMHSNRTTCRILLFTIATLLLTCCFWSGSRADLIGEWHGQINRDDLTWEVWLHVAQTATGHEVRVSFPEWPMFLLETDSIIVEDSLLSFRTKWLDSRFNGSLDGSALTGEWLLWGDSLQASMIRSSENPRVPESEDFVVETQDGGRLAARLILPDGEPPYPAMVFTHGSGPDTRITGPYIGKANLAVLSGLAVLVYDKRGAGESEGSGGFRTERLTADALAMRDWLNQDSRIRADRIGIGGISQGGYVAPRAVFRQPEFAFMFTVSAPALSPAELNVFAMKNRLYRQGTDSTIVREAVDGLRSVYRYYNTGVPEHRQTAVDRINSGDTTWTKSAIFNRMLFSSNGEVPDNISVRNWDLMFFEPLKYWTEVRVPVLAIWGEQDVNVPALFSQKTIAAALEFAGNSDVRLIVYPECGHGITLEDLTPGDFPRAAPGYVETMRRWFREQASK